MFFEVGRCALNQKPILCGIDCEFFQNRQKTDKWSKFGWVWAMNIVFIIHYQFKSHKWALKQKLMVSMKDVEQIWAFDCLFPQNYRKIPEDTLTVDYVTHAELSSSVAIMSKLLIKLLMGGYMYLQKTMWNRFGLYFLFSSQEAHQMCQGTHCVLWPICKFVFLRNCELFSFQPLLDVKWYLEKKMSWKIFSLAFFIFE